VHLWFWLFARAGLQPLQDNSRRMEFRRTWW
jgi:hypothetical protein